MKPLKKETESLLYLQETIDSIAKESKKTDNEMYLAAIEESELLFDLALKKEMED